MRKILLSLGSLVTIVAPVATIVSCGSVDQLPGEKTRTKNLLKGYGFDSSTKSDFIKRIDEAQDVNTVSKIGEEIMREGGKLTDKNDLLDSPRKLSLGDLDTYDKLDKEKIKDYTNKINRAKNEDDINTIKNQAQKENAELALKENLVKWEATDENDFNEGCYIDRDIKLGFEKMKAATTKDELTVAYKELFAKRNNPVVSSAIKDDFMIVQNNGGPELFFRKDATELTWTDMSKKDQPYITYKKTGVDQNGVPTLDVYLNGVKQGNSGSFTIQKVDEDDCGIVLEDFSGSYHVDGVKDSDAFGSNLAIKDFLKRSKLVLDSKSASYASTNYIHIEGMKELLNKLFQKDDKASYSGLEIDEDGKMIFW